MLRGIVRLVIHAENECGVGIGGGRRNDDFLHGAADVLARVGPCREQARGFDHDRRADRSPVELRGVLDAENLEALAINGDRVVRVGHLIGKIAEDRIVFQQMRERLRIRDVVDGYDFDRGIAKRRAKDVAADASETVNSDFHCHMSSGGLPASINLREYFAGSSLKC